MHSPVVAVRPVDGMRGQNDLQEGFSGGIYVPPDRKAGTPQGDALSSTRHVFVVVKVVQRSQYLTAPPAVPAQVLVRSSGARRES